MPGTPRCRWPRGKWRSRSNDHRLGRGQHKPPGNGDDNAARESFWSALKRERIYRRHFATQAEARAASFDWINVLYNRTRRRSALGFQSPVDFETKLN